MSSFMTKQVRYIKNHMIILSNLYGRAVTLNEAGIDWSHHLAQKFRSLYAQD